MEIKELKTFSSKVEKQTAFYNQLLGLEVIESKNDSTSLRIGKSILKIEYKVNATPYHFAINIPSNKILEALGWLKGKAEILRDGTNEIHNFDNWKAKSLYFYDEDRNIVELIARQNLNILSNCNFNSTLFIELSEIGLATTNIKKEVRYLQSDVGLTIYDGGSERFCAVGSENGLFICVDKNKKKWFPTNDKAFSSSFEITLIEKEKMHRIEYKNEFLKRITNQ